MFARECKPKQHPRSGVSQTWSDATGAIHPSRGTICFTMLHATCCMETFTLPALLGPAWPATGRARKYTWEGPLEMCRGPSGGFEERAPAVAVAEVCRHAEVRMVRRERGGISTNRCDGNLLMTTFRNLSGPFADAQTVDSANLGFDYKPICRLPNFCGQLADETQNHFCRRNSFL
jgi:hypothetical protein